MSYKFSNDSLNLIYTLKLENDENFSKLINAYSKIKILEDTKDERSKVLITIWEKQFNELISDYNNDNTIKLNENYKSSIENDLSDLNISQKPDPNLIDFLLEEKNKKMKKKVNEINDNINENILSDNKDEENKEIVENESSFQDNSENNLDLFLQETIKEFPSKTKLVEQETIIDQKIISDENNTNELGSIEHKIWVEKTIEYNDKMILSLKEEIKNQKKLTKQQKKEKKLQKKLYKLKSTK